MKRTKSKKPGRQRLKTQKQLRAKYWMQLRNLICRRDNWECQNPACGKGDCLQVDHCFSRGNNSLFFEPSNLTTLCSSCHYKKTYGVHGFEKMVDKIVQDREGKPVWLLMEQRAKQPYKWTEEEVCEIIKKLEAELR